MEKLTKAETTLTNSSDGSHAANAIARSLEVATIIDGYFDENTVFKMQ